MPEGVGSVQALQMGGDLKFAITLLFSFNVANAIVSIHF